MDTIILRIYTPKKSYEVNDIGDSWRQYLFNGLLNNSDNRVLKILNGLERFGLIYPRKFPWIDIENCQWHSNLTAANELCAMLNLTTPTEGFIEFPAGSMFWAKTQALKPLLEFAFTPEHFEEERGQSDNTLMHAIERSISDIALAQGYPIGLLDYPSAISYYP